jgi:hypothetical protein
MESNQREKLMMQDDEAGHTVWRSCNAACKARVIVPTEQFLFVQLKTV